MVLDEPNPKGVVKDYNHQTLLVVHPTIYVHELPLAVAKLLAGQYLFAGAPGVYLVALVEVHDVYDSILLAVDVHYGIVHLGSQQDDLLRYRLKNVLDFVYALVRVQEVQLGVDGLAGQQSVLCEALAQLELLEVVAPEGVDQVVLPSIQHHQEDLVVSKAER